VLCAVIGGQVVITGLYATESNQTVNFDRPVKAVALDPSFYKPSSGKQYVTGDDKVCLYSYHGNTVYCYRG
jgi:hypothetical protein